MGGEGGLTEKQKALELALLQIERQFGKGSIMRLGEASDKLNVEVIPTRLFSLGYCPGGRGVCPGGVVEIFGPEASGKTTSWPCTLWLRPKRRAASPPSSEL